MSFLSICLVMLTTTLASFSGKAMALSFYQRYNESSRCGHVIGHSLVHSLTTCAAICSEGSNCSGINLEVRDARGQRSCQLIDSWDSCIFDMTFNFYIRPLTSTTEASTTAISSTIVVSADESAATVVTTTSTLGNSQGSMSSGSLTSTDLTTPAASDAVPTGYTTLAISHSTSHNLAADLSSVASVSVTSITTTDTIDDSSTTKTSPDPITSVMSTATTSPALSTSSPSVRTTPAFPISTTTFMATSSTTSTSSSTNYVMTTTTTTADTTPETTSQSTSVGTSGSIAEESTTTTDKAKAKKTTTTTLTTSTTTEPSRVIFSCPASEPRKALVGITLIQGQAALTTLHLKDVTLESGSEEVIDISGHCQDEYAVVNLECDLSQIRCQQTSSGIKTECEKIPVINMEAICPSDMLVVSILASQNRVVSHINCCKSEEW